MAASDSPFVVNGSFLIEIGPENEVSTLVVWIVGEHDAADAQDLSDLLSSATKVGRGDVVIDLSRVKFMSAATIGVIVGCRNALKLEARAVTVRSPSPCATRLLDLCAVPYANDTESTDDKPRHQNALRSWVPVPNLARSEPSSESPTESTESTESPTESTDDYSVRSHKQTSVAEGSVT
jgi:anti-anti-sigma factor